MEEIKKSESAIDVVEPVIETLDSVIEPGKIIVIEGACDGMGKSTQFDLLRKRLEKDGKQLVKVVSWYDNEMSYTAQMVRTAKYLMEK